MVLYCSTPYLAHAEEPVAYSAVDSARISFALYFPSASDEQASRMVLHATIAPLVQAFTGPAPIATLVKQLDAADRTMITLQRHAAYLRVQSLENTQDQVIRAAVEIVNADKLVLDAAVTKRLQSLPREQIPKLGRYAFLAHQVQMDAAHALSPDMERYRGTVTEPFESGIYDAYTQQIAAIGNNKDASSEILEVRRAALSQQDTAYDEAAPVVAALLAGLVDIQNRDAIVQGYANAADRKYRSLGLVTPLITQTLAAVQAEAPAYRRYEQVLAEHAALKLGVSSILPAERDLAYAPSPHYSLSQARQLILDAFELLGQDYIVRFGQLLDPANGRLDLAGGSYRAHAGTSIATYDTAVALYFSDYNGSLKSVSTLAHEGGHAIHRELMNASGIPVYERNGPHYLFEGYAIFNELLLLDYATKIARTDEERQHALERLLWKLSTELFVSAEETAFEQSLYTEASGHALLDRAHIDAMYRKSIAPYEYWPIGEVGKSREWMRKSLIFEDPLYLVNYLYASVVAVALFDRAHSDPDFSARYATLLGKGFDADPQTLLAQMNIRLDDPALIKAASALFQRKTDELKKIYDAHTLEAK